MTTHIKNCKYILFLSFSIEHWIQGNLKIGFLLLFSQLRFFFIQNIVLRSNCHSNGLPSMFHGCLQAMARRQYSYCLSKLFIPHHYTVMGINNWQVLENFPICITLSFKSPVIRWPKYYLTLGNHRLASWSFRETQRQCTFSKKHWGDIPSFVSSQVRRKKGWKTYLLLGVSCLECFLFYIAFPDR